MPRPDPLGPISPDPLVCPFCGEMNQPRAMPMIEVVGTRAVCSVCSKSFTPPDRSAQSDPAS